MKEELGEIGEIERTVCFDFYLTDLLYAISSSEKRKAGEKGRYAAAPTYLRLYSKISEREIIMLLFSGNEGSPSLNTSSNVVIDSFHSSLP